MLDPDKPAPLYYQLAQHLLAQIEAGQYTVGGKIPSEPAMASEHGIGRPTVRQATDWLVRRGYLERRRGSGTYVLQASSPTVDLLSMAGTSRALQLAGVSDKIRIIEPLAPVARAECIPSEISGERFWFLKRLSSSDSIPLMLESFYLNGDDYSADSYPADSELQAPSLSAWVKASTGYLPVRTRQQFSIVSPNQQEQKLLQWRDALILVRRTLYFEQQLQPIYCEMLCRTDHYEFSQTIGV